MSLDLINGLFELGGAILLWMNVARLHRDKCVRGVHPVPAWFFACWGLWNLVYYPSLGQWFSVAGGALLVVANIVWVAQMVYYSSLSRR